MPDDLKQQLEQAQADYQKLYNQYQEELAFIAQWQKRMKAESEENTRIINDLRDLAHAYEKRCTYMHSENVSDDILTTIEGK